MKGTIYLSLLVLFSYSFVNANNPYGLEGFYTNTQTYSQIEVDAFNKGIRVRGLDLRHPYRWDKFRRVSRDVFSNGGGIEIKIKGRDPYGESRLLVRDRRGIISTYYQGLIHHRHRPHMTCTTIIDNNSDWDDCNNYNEKYDRREERYQHRERLNNDRIPQNDYYSDNRQRDDERNQRLEGTYETDDGRYIALLETRDGFKAKFKGERKWKNYTKIMDKFVDIDGNFYRISNVNDLI